MAGYGVANERLRVLEELEREIGASLQSAGTVILELSKEKAGERLLERQAAQFSAAVQKVESELSAQIRYLTQVRGRGRGAGPRSQQCHTISAPPPQVATGQPHEGSSYSARKACQMALNRVDYARLKLGELARACEQMLEP
ncbi:MED11 polymerase, partial [Circaetus pectoralis]|nr:MED11 polymerase [Circaetus pectoralis]